MGPVEQNLKKTNLTAVFQSLYCRLCQKSMFESCDCEHWHFASRSQHECTSMTHIGHSLVEFAKHLFDFSVWRTNVPLLSCQHGHCSVIHFFNFVTMIRSTLPQPFAFSQLHTLLAIGWHWLMVSHWLAQNSWVRKCGLYVHRNH